jgi:hypothetical protein
MVGALNHAMCMHTTQFNMVGGWVLTLVSKFLQTSVIGTLVCTSNNGCCLEIVTKRQHHNLQSLVPHGQFFFFKQILNTARL